MSAFILESTGRETSAQQGPGLHSEVTGLDTAAYKRGHLASYLQMKGKGVYIMMRAGDLIIYFISPGDSDFLKI